MGCNQILDRYIEQLIETSTPQAPAWNIEKIRAGKENTWNYIDGCMIKALIELYEITGEQRYLTFADDYIDFFVQDDGTIKHYNPEEYNLDNVNAGKTLYKLYDLVGKPKYRAAMDTIYRQLVLNSKIVRASRYQGEFSRASAPICSSSWWARAKKPSSSSRRARASSTVPAARVG